MNKELKPYHVHLICNAKYHDSDFARVELLKLLYEHDGISVTVSDNYDNFENFFCSKFYVLSFYKFFLQPK